MDHRVVLVPCPSLSAREWSSGVPQTLDFWSCVAWESIHGKERALHRCFEPGRAGAKMICVTVFDVTLGQDTTLHPQILLYLHLSLLPSCLYVAFCVVKDPAV